MQEIKTEPIKFEDGREGERHSYFVHGYWKIQYIAIRKRVDGKHCEGIYSVGGRADEGTYRLDKLKGEYEVNEEQSQQRDRPK